MRQLNAAFAANFTPATDKIAKLTALTTSGTAFAICLNVIPFVKTLF